MKGRYIDPMLAVLYAMDEEVQGVHNCLERRCVFPHPWATVERGWIDGHELLLVKSGAGKVLSSITAQSIITLFAPKAIALCGVSGGLNPKFQRGDLVIGSDFIQHDVSAEFLGFARGQIPFTDIRVIPATATLLSHARLLELGDKSIHDGRIVSGDYFVSGSEGQKLREAFNADVVDMESAAVAFTCYMNQVPFIVARTISDSANEVAETEFTEFLPSAARHVTSFIKHLLPLLSTN